MTDVAAEGRLKTARDDLVKEPSNVDKLVAFYTAAVTERHEATSTKKASRAGQPSTKKLLVMKESFPLLLSDLASSINQGKVLDMQQEVCMKAFEARLNRNATMRQAQYRFLAELGKAYEQQAIKMHEMRQSYYREIDHLRDQLGIKARNPSFDMKEVQFFDAKAYRPLSWKELADLLLVQRIEANGGERTVELVPVRVLCRDCRNKFASEVPDLPQDAESQVTPDMILTELPPEENVEYTAQGVSRWAQTEISVQAQVDCSVQTEARPEFFPASPEESAREVSFRQVTLSFDTALLEAADSPPFIQSRQILSSRLGTTDKLVPDAGAESRPLSFEPEWHEATFAHDADERAVAGAKSAQAFWGVRVYGGRLMDSCSETLQLVLMSCQHQSWKPLATDWTFVKPYLKAGDGTWKLDAHNVGQRIPEALQRKDLSYMPEDPEEAGSEGRE
ncbi:unnamed protein product [Effrenium voratum]|nr:unnamed protein product [Effrenium voratum]